MLVQLSLYVVRDMYCLPKGRNTQQMTRFKVIKVSFSLTQVGGTRARKRLAQATRLGGLIL